VLDIKCLLDVERYRKVNIDATAATELFASPPLLAPERNTGFLKDCVNRFREINFAHQSTGRVYLHIIADQVSWVDPQALARAIEDADTRAALHAVIPAAFDPSRPAPSRPQFLARSEQRKTVGRWGSPDSSPGAEQP
jgi:hypothetical protein